ncbi:hypothetical protein JCM10213_005062 [Rhodosporidiobolus nylandii]
MAKVAKPKKTVSSSTKKVKENGAKEKDGGARSTYAERVTKELRDKNPEQSAKDRRAEMLALWKKSKENPNREDSE